MDGLSAAASGMIRCPRKRFLYLLRLRSHIVGMAVISLALQLAGGCIKLYDFWGSVQDAPREVSEVLVDLKLLSSILNELVKRKNPSVHVKNVLEHCDTKVEVR
jgi:hypothetical protein